MDTGKIENRQTDSFDIDDIDDIESGAIHSPQPKHLNESVDLISEDESLSAKKDQTIILVVDDTPDKLEVMQALLSYSGYTVLTAQDGREGLNIAKLERPDLVISDVSMPRLDGIEMCRLMRKDPVLQAIPVLLVSAYRKDSESVVAGLKAGADDYLEAPYDPVHLIAKISQLIERKRSEERLAESEQRYKSLFEHNTDTIFSLDLEGRFVSANPASFALTGYTLEELQSESFVSLVIPEDRERAQEQAQKAILGELQDYEATILSKTGRRIDLTVKNVPIVINGKVTGIYGIAKDVTERRRIEQKAHESKARLTQALDAARMGIWDYNVSTGEMMWSARAEELYGLKPGTFSGSLEAAFEFLRPEQREFASQELRNAIKHGGAYDSEYQIVHPDGTVRWIASKGEVLNDPTGQPAHLSGT